MDGGQLYGRGMSFPPRVGDDGRIAWSEGETNIREAIQVILRTQERERLANALLLSLVDYASRQV